MAETGTRRDWLSRVLMGLGLLLSYGTLAAQGLMFILPRRLKPKTRRLFAGQIDQYELNSVQRFFDLQGNEILVKRSPSGFEAFSSTCPHLGCRVHWVPEQQVFFCPCHRGVFNADGVPISKRSYRPYPMLSLKNTIVFENLLLSYADWGLHPSPHR